MSFSVVRGCRWLSDHRLSHNLRPNLRHILCRKPLPTGCPHFHTSTLTHVYVRLLPVVYTYLSRVHPHFLAHTSSHTFPTLCAHTYLHTSCRCNHRSTLSPGNHRGWPGPNCRSESTASGFRNTATSAVSQQQHHYLISTCLQAQRPTHSINDQSLQCIISLVSESADRIRLGLGKVQGRATVRQDYKPLVSTENCMYLCNFALT